MLRSTRDETPDLQTLGRDLQVQAVLTGKYALSGNNLLISVELSEVRDNRHIWGEQYTEFDDLAAVREEVSRRVTEMLRLKLTWRSDRESQGNRR